MISNNTHETNKSSAVAEKPPAIASGGLLNHLKVSVISTIILAVICCGFYPLIVWGISQAVFRDKANGSLIKDDKGNVIASKLIGQAFTDGKYFHLRPSAAGTGYDATASSGSNLGPTSSKLLNGTTKDSVFTILAHDASKSAGDMTGRIEANFVAIADNNLTVNIPGSGNSATKPASYPLDAAVVITAQGRTLSKTFPGKDATIEIKLSSTTKPTVTAITVIDKVVEGVVTNVDTSGNKIRLKDATGVETDYAVNNPVVVVNSKSDAKFADVPAGSIARILTATVEDNDGIADRVIHYCEDNNIDYTTGIDIKSFKDADGIDDVKLINAFTNATDAKLRTITPKILIPADAVTASASGLDPHISPENAKLQISRVADIRKTSTTNIQKLIDEHTDGRDLGILGDPGVNVVMLNLALDKTYPVPAAPATQPSTQPVAK